MITCGRKLPISFPSFRERFPWIGGDLQTLHNTIYHATPSFSHYPAQRIEIPLSDGSGDRLLGIINRPATDDASPLVIIIHGLVGSETSPSIMTSAWYLLTAGFQVMRLNLRGAGPSKSTCGRHYHAGQSQDLADTLTALTSIVNTQAVFVFAMSLGGNMLLKFLGEGRNQDLLRGAIAVSAPIRLRDSQQRIMAPRNAAYHKHLLTHMKRAAVNARNGSSLRPTIETTHTIYEFDDRIVAPNNGFVDAEDYYDRCSAEGFLDKIGVPTLIIHARNDPWIPSEVYLDRTWDSDGAVSLLITSGGGHVGFHGARCSTPWHDRAACTFFRYLL